MSNKKEIKCPKCGALFQIDESNYNDLLNQIKEREVSEKINILKKDIENDYKLKLNNEEMKYNKLLNEKNNLEIEFELKKQKDISNLKEENSKQLNELKEKNFKLSSDKQEIEKQFLIKEKIYKDEIENLRNYKTSLNIKVLGEKLEQYCCNEFNKIKPIAFPDAKFEKDNEVSSESHSKGDFIFRNYANDGTEFISIMFEMKNQHEVTKTKQKNEHFFKELDKDRKEKKCEYAVLVSELEMENDLYNLGIVDVSFSGYEKMYVVRPNYFISIISLLNNAAKSSINYKQQLNAYKSRDVDVTNFEDNLKRWKEDYNGNYIKARKRFGDAIKEIDKTINTLNKIKENLLGSEKQLTHVNDKIQGMTIRKLTHNSPTMKEKFKFIKDKDNK